MRCEPIEAAMERLGEVCGGVGCAECLATGFCLELRKRYGFTISGLQRSFDKFFYGEPRQKAAVLPPL